MATATSKREPVEVPVLGVWEGRRGAAAGAAEEEVQVEAAAAAGILERQPRNPCGKRFRSTSSSRTPGAQRQHMQTMNV